MRTVLLLCCMFSGWCAEAATTWESLPAPARALVERILASNRLLEPELDAVEARRAFVELVAACRSPAGGADAEAVTRHLSAAILTGRRVGYLSRQYWRDSSFAAALLRKQGNCLATTTLYVAVARALDLPIQAVFVPQHVFARWSDDDQRLNIETTDGGAVHGDYSYLARFAIDDMGYFGWMASASDERLLAELDQIAARHLHGQGRLAEAIAALETVCATLPQRRDLELLVMEWRAQQDGERTALLARARALAGDLRAPRPAVVAAVLCLAADHRARLERAQERAALLRAYALAPWHQQDEIMELLSLCLRGLRDHSGAVLCMELAVARDPQNLGKRAWLAGMLSEAKRHDEALALIASVRAENPEETFFATMQAGMLVQAGRREEGRRIYDALEPPRTGLEIFETNRAWFLAVWGDRATFYPQFERVLASARDPGVLSWIAEDDDLDAYRDEARFQAAVAAARLRILGR